MQRSCWLKENLCTSLDEEQTIRKWRELVLIVFLLFGIVLLGIKKVQPISEGISGIAFAVAVGLPCFILVSSTRGLSLSGSRCEDFASAAAFGRRYAN